MKIDPVIGKDKKEEEGEIWDEEALDALFNETVRFSVVNSYVSAITELYAWQLQSEGKASPPLRGAKLSAMLGSVRRDEDRIRRVNFIERTCSRSLAATTSKGLKRRSPDAGKWHLRCRA